MYSKKSFDSKLLANHDELIKEADALNQFSIELYKKLIATDDIKKGENVFISPFSVRNALALALPATKKGSMEQKQLSSALRIETPDSPLNLRLKTQLLGLKDSLKESAKENGEFEIINQVFFEKTANVKERYLAFLKENYNSGVAKFDFKSSDDASEASRKVINKYVSRVTKEKITSLLPEKSIKRETRSVFLNAIYMKLNWGQRFEDSFTKIENFNLENGFKVQVNMMRQTASYFYTEE